jgi:hypothetical protein
MLELALMVEKKSPRLGGHAMCLQNLQKKKVKFSNEWEDNLPWGLRLFIVLNTRGCVHAMIG